MEEELWITSVRVMRKEISPDQAAKHTSNGVEPYSPKAAKKLLADAGFADGFSTDLWVMPVARAYMPNANLMAELIREDWANIGVQVSFKTAP